MVSSNMLVFIRPRLRYEDIQRIFNQQKSLILWVRRGVGLTDFGGLPIEIEAKFSMSREEYERRREFRWPCPVFLQTAKDYQQRYDVTDKRMIDLLNAHLSEE